LFLISGEPGIGKTRITEELSIHAREHGMRVIWARCWGNGAPAYWPWVQIFRACVDNPGGDQLYRLVESDAPQVTVLLPGAPGTRTSPVRQLHAVALNQPEVARFHLFDSAARLLKNVARAAPLVIVLDDLQEADQSSLLMLRFAARELKEAPVLIVGNYREGEVRASPALSRLIGEIAREGHQIVLGGFSQVELTDFVERSMGLTANPELVTALMQATAGNPLFVDGALRVFIAQEKELNSDRINARDFTLPGAVAETIRRRLSLLSASANEVLSIAAVIGAEFDFDCVREVSGHAAPVLVEALDEARRDGLLYLVLAGNVRYRFAHDLIRATIYEDLPAAKRLQLHWQLAQVLETNYQADLTDHCAQIAHHYCESVAIGSPAKAIDYLIRAGEAALAVSAYEEVRDHWQAALDLMNQYEPKSSVRAELLRKHGSLTFSTHDYNAGIRFLEVSLELSKQLGERRLEGLALLELGLARSRPFTIHSDIPRALIHYRASEHLLNYEGDPLTRAMLQLGRARAALEALETAEGLAATERGMEITHSESNAGLWASLAGLRAVHLRMFGRISEARSLLATAEKRAFQNSDIEFSEGAGTFYLLMRYPTESKRLLVMSLNATNTTRADRARRSGYLVHVEVSLGNLAEAKRLVESNSVNSLFRSLIAFREGDFEEARNLILQQLDHSRKIGNKWNQWAAMSNLIEVLRAEDDRQQANTTLAEAVELYTPAQLYCDVRIRPQATLLALDVDRAIEAEKHLQICRLILKGGEDWLGLTGAVERAEAAMAGAYGKITEANQNFGRAIDTFRQYGLVWEIADTLHYWGRALLKAREYHGALEKLDSAIEVYRRHSAGQRWIDSVEADRKRALDTATRPSEPQLTQRPELTACFHQDGEFWTIRYNQASIHLMDAKGLRYIAYLLAHPGERFHILELVAAVESKDGANLSEAGPTAEALAAEIKTTCDLGNAGPTLDLRARRDYRRRLHELRDELEEARRFNDLGRIEKIQREIETITAEISAASGLHGRARESADHVERARSMVSKRIRATIAKVQQQNGSLGHHLATYIKTGYFCAYLPDPERKIAWQF
jgi:predicted ATPase